METLLNLFMINSSGISLNIIQYLEELRIFDIRVLDVTDITELSIRFLINIFVATIVIRFLYYPVTRNRDYLFSYFTLSASIFFVCNLLSNIKLEIGFAFGLFAIFSILRYRTETIHIREMSYLFIVICISVINAMASRKISYSELIFTNFTLILIAYLLDSNFLLKKEMSKMIRYEKIELIKPENKEKLLEDLRLRTGFNITHYSIDEIDFLRDIARITIFYRDK